MLITELKEIFLSRFVWLEVFVSVWCWSLCARKQKNKCVCVSVVIHIVSIIFTVVPISSVIKYDGFCMVLTVFIIDNNIDTNNIIIDRFLFRFICNFFWIWIIRTIGRNIDTYDGCWIMVIGLLITQLHIVYNIWYLSLINVIIIMSLIAMHNNAKSFYYSHKDACFDLLGIGQY